MGTAAARNRIRGGGANPEPVIIIDEAANRMKTGDVNNATATAIAGTVDVLPIGRYNSTLPTITTAQYNALQVGARGALNVQIMSQDGVAGTVVAAQSSDAVSGTNGGLQANAAGYGFNGATWDRLRAPNIFKPFSVTVASLGVAPQTVWTTASTNKRFRMMGYTLTSNKAASVQFRDGSVATFFASGALVASTPASSPSGLGNGYLSASANNTLNLDVDTAVPVIISGTVWGTEEV